RKAIEIRRFIRGIQTGEKEGITCWHRGDRGIPGPTSAKRSARRQTPGGPRVDFRGTFSSETNPAGFVSCKKGIPPELEVRRGVGLDGSAVFGSSPQPSGLPEPAGRFHRGATRGELVVMTVADTSHRCRRRTPVGRCAEWPAERFGANNRIGP